MRYADMNMGLLGPRFTLEGHGRCVFHDPGDELSQTIWDSFEPSLMKLVGDPVQRAERGNLAEAVYWVPVIRSGQCSWPDDAVASVKSEEGW